jgi:methionine-S-sulfoxide reductase
VKNETAIFAAGCFWGVQYYFDQVPGVLKTTAGYTGGTTKTSDYWSIHENETGHVEAVLIEFDPKKVSYETLVRHFFRIHDPTALNAADGINIGSTYRSALFYSDDSQMKVAEKIREEEQKKHKKPIVTEFSKASEFYEAEPEHQKFTQRTGMGACHVDYAPV